MHLEYDKQWTWHPQFAPEYFGYKFDRIVKQLFKHTYDQGYYIKNNPWSKFIEERYFPDVDLVNLSSNQTSIRYQAWLDIYMNINKNLFKIDKPFAKTIVDYYDIYRRRPPWGQSFEAKKISKDRLGSNMVCFRNTSNNEHGWIERELVLDNYKRKVLIERHLNRNGYLQAVGIVSEQQIKPSSFLFRFEKKSGTTKFTTMYCISHQTDFFNFHEAFAINVPVFPNQLHNLKII